MFNPTKENKELIILDKIFQFFFNDIEIEEYRIDSNKNVIIYFKNLIGVRNVTNANDKFYVFLKNNENKMISKYLLLSVLKKYTTGIFNSISIPINRV
jgi:sRNA-binding regulator protein Hfq